MIGSNHLRDGNHDMGIPFLHQALTIYQRIEAPAAKRVHDTFSDQGRVTKQDDSPSA